MTNFPFKVSITENNLRSFKSVLDENLGFTINTMIDGYSVLGMACVYSSFDIVQYVIELRVDANKKFGEQMSPLTLACGKVGKKERQTIKNCPIVTSKRSFGG